MRLNRNEILFVSCTFCPNFVENSKIDILTIFKLKLALAV